jgi:lipid A 3-O-deacylase
MKRFSPSNLPLRNALLATLAVLVVLAAGGISPAAAAALGPEEVAVGAGFFGALDHHHQGAEAGAELRFSTVSLPRLPHWLRIQPTAGIAANDHHGLFAYAGFRLPFELAGRWTVTPFSGAGLYRRGEGKELGGAVEFRSGLEVAIRIQARSQLGLTFYHLSNAGIYTLNPGTESLELVYSVRFGR